MITFSGIDCSGKSTQIEKYCLVLDKQGKKYEVIWSRGGYTPGIMLLKKLFRNNKGKTREQIVAFSQETNSNPRKRKLLFIAGEIDLLLYYSIVLRLKELTGKTIICDRYIWDTYIDYRMRYPDYDIDNDLLWKRILKWMKKPDQSVVLTIPADESMRRSELKEEPFPEDKEKRIERINLYMKEILNGRWMHVIDADKPIEEVFKELISLIEPKTITHY